MVCERGIIHIMKLKLNDEYRIITSDSNFIPQQLKVIQASRLTKEENVGKEVWKDLGYFTNLQSALKSIPTNIMLENDDLGVIIDKLNKIENNIKGIKEFMEIRRG